MFVNLFNKKKHSSSLNLIRISRKLGFEENSKCSLVRELLKIIFGGKKKFLDES